MCPLPEAGREIRRGGRSSCPCPTRSPFRSSAPGPSVRQALGSGLPHEVSTLEAESLAVVHIGHWKSPRILESSVQGLGLKRMRQTRGGSWGPGVPTPTCASALGPPQAPGPLPFARVSTGSCPAAACQQHSLPRPWFFLLEITGLLCQVPAPASPPLVTTGLCLDSVVWLG